MSPRSNGNVNRRVDVPCWCDNDFDTHQLPFEMHHAQRFIVRLLLGQPEVTRSAILSMVDHEAETRSFLEWIDTESSPGK